MLSKLESAVDKISEGNNRIATILAKHDERIDQSIKSDGLIIKMIEDMKEENKSDHQAVRERIDKLETKVEDVLKTKWMTVGIATVMALFITVLTPIISGLFTPQIQIKEAITNKL
jgi:FtsZ-binding cell division protein ZapB